MKIIATYQNHLFDSKHHAVLSLNVANYQHTQMLSTLDQDKIYQIEIKERKSKRSIEQNALMWSLLHELEKATREPAFDWYVKALIDTGAECVYIVAPKGSKDILMNSYRAVVPVCKRMIVNPVENKETEGIMYRCFVGSSKFNVSQMNELIDTVLRYCDECDIEVD